MNRPNDIWICKSVSDEDRAYGIEGYADELSTKYVYDNNVANSKQMKAGDFILITDKNNILGAAKITRINSGRGEKTRIRCPECGSTNITTRTTVQPKFKCNKGHEFTLPIKQKVETTTFEAMYGETFIDLKSSEIPLSSLRPHYDRGYNRNMSIQHISPTLNLKNLNEVLVKLKGLAVYPSPEDGDNTEEEFDPTGERTKNKVYRQITARRGQPKFREKLRKRYNDTCVITGCKIIEVIEAAHIQGYRDEKDNHPQNGLLLRADIHTLFDLDLIGIEPDTLKVRLSKSILNSEYADLDGKSIYIGNKGPNKEALRVRWSEFIKSN